MSKKDIKNFLAKSHHQPLPQARNKTTTTYLADPKAKMDLDRTHFENVQGSIT
jgi:hypothetical protein